MQKEFLKEYELLCQRYNMGLNGCGCCGSPYLDDIEYVVYNKTLNKVFINGDGFWHEKYKSLDECEEYNKHCYKSEKTIEEYFKDGE